MTFLKQLRDAAAACTNPDYKARLKLAADELQAAINGLHAEPDEDNMKYLNGLWALAHRVLKNTPHEADPQPPSAIPHAYGTPLDMAVLMRKAA